MTQMTEFHIENFKMAIDKSISNLCKFNNQSFINEFDKEVWTVLRHNKFNITSIEDDINKRDWPADRKEYLLETLQKHHMEIVFATLLKENLRYGSCLVDFDWNMKMVLGSNKNKSEKFPQLELILDQIDKNGIKTKNMYNIRKDVLQELIQDLNYFINKSED